MQGCMTALGHCFLTTVSSSGRAQCPHQACLSKTTAISGFIIIIIIIIYSLTTRVVGASQMISQPVSSIFPCSSLPSGTWRTPGLSIPSCCLPTSSSVCLVFFPLSLCLARWFWPELMNGRHDQTTAVFVSLLCSGGLRVVRLPAGSWHGHKDLHTGIATASGLIPEFLLSELCCAFSPRDKRGKSRSAPCLIPDSGQCSAMLFLRFLLTK